MNKGWLNTNKLILLLCIITAMLLSGCHVKISVGTNGYLTGEYYSDAEKYSVGAFTYNSSEIQKVDVYWRCGEVKLVESDKEELCVKESGSKLTEKNAVHYFLSNGVLMIRFCESDAKININENDKRLYLEVPREIDISVHTTSATVEADTLDEKNILIAALSGDIQLGTVAAENINLSNGSGFVYATDVSAKSLKCNTAAGAVKLNDVSFGIAEITTGDGNIELKLDKASTAVIRTSGGKVGMALPADGAEVSYITNSGKLLTDCVYERKGDLYLFGEGKSNLAIESFNGNLIIN